MPCNSCCPCSITIPPRSRHYRRSRRTREGCPHPLSYCCMLLRKALRPRDQPMRRMFEEWPIAYSRRNLTTLTICWQDGIFAPRESKQRVPAGGFWIRYGSDLCLSNQGESINGSEPSYRDWHGAIRCGAVAKLAIVVISPTLESGVAVQHRARVIRANRHGLGVGDTRNSGGHGTACHCAVKLAVSCLPTLRGTIKTSVQGLLRRGS